MKITVAMPTPFQTSTTATESSAMSGLLSHAGPSIPRIAKVRLIRPSDGCINTANVIPTATVLMSTGKKMIDRSAERMWILEVRSVASNRPRMTFEPLVTTA